MIAGLAVHFKENKAMKFGDSLFYHCYKLRNTVCRRKLFKWLNDFIKSALRGFAGLA